MFDGILKFFKNQRPKIAPAGLVLAVVIMTGVFAGPAFTSTGKPFQSEMPATVTLAPLAEALKPSVVNIRVTKVQKAVHGIPGIPEGSPFEDFFGRFFGPGGPQPHDRRVQGAGSGVIISDDGYILTNNHVVEGAKEVVVTLDDGREIEAEIVGLDPKTDLAVLKIEGDDDLPGAPMGDSDEIRVGDYVMAIGNPFGLGHTVTAGIVSAKGRVIGAGPYDDFIQTDASINPGNSGGPLINMHGEVVGVNTAIMARGQGIGFAIPVNTVKALVPQLVEHGEVTRGYIGVHIQPITRDLAEAMGLDEQKGALVADVLPGGPASEAGVQRGDVIVSFNAKAVEKSHELPAMVADAPVGERASITVLRDGKEKKLTIRVGELQDETAAVKSSDRDAGTRWGLGLQDLTPQIARQLGVEADQGAVVTEVAPGSPAQRASLRPGDVILEVNRRPVASAEEAVRAVAGEDSVLLLVQRKDVKQFVAMAG